MADFGLDGLWARWGSAASMATALSVGLSASACGGKRDDTGAGSSGLTAATVGLDTEDSASTGVSGTGDVRLDIGDGQDGGGDELAEEGCQKVDLLFVVDNSTSMGDNQRNLSENVPGWISAIQTSLGPTVNDFHIGVTTSDEYRSHPEECKQMGALVTQVGEGGCEWGVQACPTTDPSRRFLTEDDDLNASFPCIALVGDACGSSNEQPIAATIAALSPDLNAEGACNAGFIRGDAVLVVVIVSDEPDNTPGEALDWFPQIVNAKGGIETNIVMVSLIGWGENPQSRDQCDIAVGDNFKVAELTEMFTYGFVDHVCAQNYGESLAEALEAIKSACDDYVPVE